MIYGIGIDIVKIDRLREVAGRWGNRFLKRVFTEVEIAYCFERKDPYLSLAVRFAAKEALIKAIGPDAPVSFSDVEIENDSSGRPFIRLKGRLREFFEDRGLKGVHLSLSHEKEFGVASVVIEAEASAMA